MYAEPERGSEMIDKRQKNAEIFRDTQKMYNTEPALVEAVSKGAGKTEKKIIYSEPAEYFPREIRKKYKLGEFNDSFSQR